MKNHANVYFDESGFTGNKLLDVQQPIFCYASVVIEDEEAKLLVEYIIKKYKIQNGEIKGGKLVKKNKGRRAIDEILTALHGKMKVSVSDKKYALAGKFFEYIFEPSLARINSIFYQLNFHKFVSTMLYLELVNNQTAAEYLFEEFEELMRSGDFTNLKLLFGGHTDDRLTQTMGYILTFTLKNKTNVEKELDGYIGEGSGKWSLDLTNTSLYTLLSDWGQSYETLTAYCDKSKPLETDHELLDAMVGREDKVYSTFGDQRIPITFNLTESINLVDSQDYAGVQLADAVAAAFSYACNRNNQDEFAIKWRDLIEDVVTYGSVFPDFDHIDPSRMEALRNGMILQELARRSENNEDLLFGITDFIQDATVFLNSPEFMLAKE
ncbi:Protein of uncharacterised function (DUF3800) [Plesiomonas shigelloides]|uniref:DUF3800 domain-containing protein n=1 Tax=Plesiomonas shigelloides TaxID=703 RepID=UPI0007F0746B|nr:DUF3800 domain-containing protein [Plesiomonas shigelloides]SBT60938.1 Protein of uncharacterised function (DUF3800) [Plesiomonas shigelloides]